MAITETHSRMIGDLNAGTTYVESSQVGTAAGNIVQLDGSAKLPAVDGSLLTNAGKLLQQVHASTSAVATGTTVMADDDTIPQNTEGNEAITLAITPTNASNRLLITATVFHSMATTACNIITALFQDSTANALAAVVQEKPNDANAPFISTLTHEMAAGTTSATTFKIRAGANAGGTWTLNGWGGARRMGGVASTTLTITEIAV